jgi:hypothetical protein
VSYQEFPKVTSRFSKGWDVISIGGAFFFFLPFILLYLTTINEILHEKE